MELDGSPESVLRVVLDTNILISAFLFGGLPLTILRAEENGKFISLTSEPLRIELAGVLAEKFSLPKALIDQTCRHFWQISEWIEPKKRITLCEDEDDNRILECAMEGRANYVVTGDRDLLRLPPFPDFSVLTPREFLDRLGVSW